ncbi:MAG: IS110 family transposase [Gemmatimonadota bacterium]|nr:IS110 family transposase [Gemmatimonadota bacterium]
MTSNPSITAPVVRVAIDVAKLTHQVLMELPNGKRRTMRVANTKSEIDGFVEALRALGHRCEIAFEPTGDYHRPLAYVLGQAGFHLALVSSLAVARTREALYNSWDKNDPKDAQVILHLLKNGTTQRYLDPLVTGHLDLQEMANTYQQISLRKVRLQHSLITHHLPLYFPEAERYLHSSRAEWFTALLLFAPCPAAVRQYSKAAFVKAASAQIAGRKVDRARWLADFYETACHSVGLPVTPESETVRMLRVVLEEYRALCALRKRLEVDITTQLATHPDFVRLQTLPGIGPILAMIILAEARELRRFGCARQFLKYCGFDLCTEQSGQFRGRTHLSKRGNARLRYAFWMAGTVAIRMQQNSFRRKFEDYIRPDPKNADRRRKGYTAVAAKMARVAYAVVTSGIDYRRFPEATRPGGKIPSLGAVEAHATS